MKKIVIYALSTCLWCRKTKKYFEEKGLPYESVEYDKLDDKQQTEVIKHIKACGGTGSFPFVKIDGACVQGFNPEDFDRALEGK